jgi:hypothetical protein
MTIIEEERYHYGAIYNNCIRAVRQLEDQIRPLLNEAQYALAVIRDGRLNMQENLAVLAVYQEFGK